ncbi:MAG TPA: polysaccharide deacetylase family protein [Nitrososphaeraceae archaeon]
MTNTSERQRTFNYKKITSMWAVSFCIILLISLSSNSLINESSVSAIATNNFHRPTNEINDASSKCNCVVFRMDDIQDYWLNSVQSAVMDLFMSKGQKLSLGLIMHIVGNDSKVVDKIKTGLDKGLFELDAHGWDHINYTKLNQNEQKQSLYNASSKMEKLFGIRTGCIHSTI